MLEPQGDVCWTWKQWELVGLQRDAASVVIDVIELSSDHAQASDTLLTVSLAPAAPGDATLVELTDTLARWVESDAVCDVLQQEDEPHGALALFQESQLLLFEAPIGSPEAGDFS